MANETTSSDHRRTDLEERGDEHFSAREFDRAIDLYTQVAEAAESPGGELCVKLARACLATDQFSDASRWALQVVDEDESFKTWSAAARVLDRCPAEAIPRIRANLRVAITGTWTTRTFSPLLRLAAARLGIAAKIYESDFGQYFNETLDPGSRLFTEDPDAILLTPDHRSMSVPPWSESAQEAVDSEVERWSRVWSAVPAMAPRTVIQHGFALPGADPLGHYATGLEGSRRRVQAAVNSQLARLAQASDIAFLDTDLLASNFGRGRWFDDRGWHLAKMPYSSAALPHLARHSAAVLAARLGFSRRCLIVDLDNTLWGGVVADDGVDGLKLGNGADGEAFVDFQHAIKELVGRGIILAVCSKNDRELAMEPFRSHPEMVLKSEDVALFVANWRPKSENIVEIAESLDLGLDSMTFIDDNPYERAEVRRALPEVDVPTLPQDPTGYRRALEDYPHFEASSFTPADRKRSEQYRARGQARKLQSAAGSLEEYQASLNMVAQVGPVDPPNIARVVQLINKTNQFNVTTRRRNRAEMDQLLTDSKTCHFWVRLRDKFADHGLVAVVLATAEAETLGIDTLLMSCRVIGRGLEDVIFAELASVAKASDCAEIRGLYIPTARNGMVADLFQRSGFRQLERDEDGQTVWSASPEVIRPPPSTILVERWDPRGVEETIR